MANSGPSKISTSTVALTEDAPLRSGTTAYAVARLARWGQLASDGLARVEFVNGFTRQHVVAALRDCLQEVGVPLHEVVLSSTGSAEEIVDDLVRQLRNLEPGVISLSGFETAFPDDGRRVDSVRILNANRERLALHPLRQIWWMTPAFTQFFLQAAPDLDSWFMLRLSVEEAVSTPPETLERIEETPVPPVSLRVARRRATSLVRRFRKALGAGASIGPLLELVSSAVSVLHEAGAEAQASELLSSLLDEMSEEGRGVEQLLTEPAEDSREALERARALHLLARRYVLYGRYAEAEPLLRHAQTLREAVLGSEHPDTARSLNDLALTCVYRGRYAEAELLYQRALAIREAALGPSHPETAASLNNLAALYLRQGRLAEVEAMLRRALATDEAAYGPGHPYVATDLNNLAQLCQRQGRPEEAEPLYQRALSISEKTLGPEHPDTATSLNNLAALYEIQGRVAEAEAMYERALRIREAALGLEHPETARSLSNLAHLYVLQNRLSEAEPLHQRSLSVREALLGPDHPDTAQSLNNLAALYVAQGRYAEAEPLVHRALSIHEKVLGPVHPESQLVRRNLAALREKMAIGDGKATVGGDCQ
jgi:tetratricopeptide (TPR) repeat protein